MTFFNKKEEVIEIKLTQYGKYLLSKGEWRPTYYAFFDDDILYDIQYADSAWYPGNTEPVSEAQNATEGRIQDETPSLRVQHIYGGAETQISRYEFTAVGTKYRRRQRRAGRVTRSPIPAGVDIEKYEQLSKDLPIPTAEKGHVLSAPMGTSDLTSEFIPAWAVNFLKGDFLTGSVSYSTGSHANLRIPQLPARVVVEVMTHGPGMNPDISGKDNQIILEVLERNSAFTNENFDIEVFEVYDAVGGSTTPGVTRTDLHEELVSLSFTEKPSLVKNNLLLDEKPDGSRARLEQEYAENDPSYVAHYMDIAIDSEIDKGTINTLDPGNQKKSIFTKD